MAQILRGEIRWADLDPTCGHEQAGLRPALIISQDVFNKRSLGHGSANPRRRDDHRHLRPLCPWNRLPCFVGDTCCSSSSRLVDQLVDQLVLRAWRLA